jgi:hypothetical protein
MMISKSGWLMALPVLALGLLSGCSLAGDITPPPGYATLPPVAPVAVSTAAAPAVDATAANAAPTADLAAATPAASGTAITAPVTVTVAVTGVITNGTPNGVVPADLVVFLHSFGPNTTDMGGITTYSTTVSAGGAFAFDNVPSQTGGQLMASARYQNVLYTSQTATVAANQTKLALPVAIYETTADASQVTVEQMHLFLDFGSGQVTVGELYILSNAGDRTVVSSQGTTQYVLPTGATNLSVQGETEGTDYITTAQGFAEINPLVPGIGSGQLLYTFDLPYTGQLSFGQKMLYPVKAAGVLLPDVGVKLQSSQLLDQGTQNVQGNPYLLYGAGSLTPGSILSFQLSGQPGSGSAASGAAQSSSATQPAAAGAVDFRTIAVGVGVLGGVVLGIGVWVYRRQSRPAAASEPESAASDQEILLQTIADLDDAFEKDEVDATAYARRRARLKAKLVEVLAAAQPDEKQAE